MTPANRALLILTSLNLLDYLDRYLIAAMGSLVKKEMDLSDSAFGFLGTAFFLVYFFSAPIFGYLGDRWGRRRLMAGGAALWSLITGLTYWVSSYPALVAARGLVAVGEASFSTQAPAYFADILPQGKRARALGLFYLALPIGTALAYLVGALVGSRWGWRPAFLVAGLPGLAMAFLIYRLPRTGSPQPAPIFGGSPRQKFPFRRRLGPVAHSHHSQGYPGVRHGHLYPGRSGVLDAPLSGDGQRIDYAPGQSGPVWQRHPGGRFGDCCRRVPGGPPPGLYSSGLPSG